MEQGNNIAVKLMPFYPFYCWTGTFHKCSVEDPQSQEPCLPPVLVSIVCCEAGVKASMDFCFRICPMNRSPFCSSKIL